ncbi:MAG: alpha/beta fold hydrolase, partial [Polyangiaceae bacterium]
MRNVLNYSGLAFFGVGIVGVLGAAGSACSSSSTTGTPVTMTTDDAGGDAGPTVGNLSLEVPCMDTMDAVFADPGPLPAVAPPLRGNIVKCSQGADIGKDALLAAAIADGYVGRPFTSGAHVYRVLYRTERGTDPATPGVSSAVVFIPDTPRAAPLPVIVVSHGTTGQAKVCSPSKKDPVDADVRLMSYPLVGSGYVAIAPDLAGYAGAPDSLLGGYAGAVDVGKSTLDGARALRTMVPSSVSEKVVIIGHSQGGHTALSALAISDPASYGSGGTVVGVVGYAPLWLSQRSWGALLKLAAVYPIHDAPLINAVSVWYHYTNGELMNPGHGLDVFADSAKAGIKHFVENDCGMNTYPELEALGTTATDLYTPEFNTAIAAAAAISGTCPSDPAAAALCQKWLDRYAADRPHLTGSAAHVPILINYGGQDTTIGPDRMKCVIDRLTTDQANFKVCVDPTANHTGVVRTRADYTNDWIANVALGEKAAEPCALDQSSLTDDATERRFSRRRGRGP